MPLKAQQTWISHKQVDLVILPPLSLAYGPIKQVSMSVKMRILSPNLVHQNYPRMKTKPRMVMAQVPMSPNF
jgi:hypothetical protein